MPTTAEITSTDYADFDTFAAAHAPGAVSVGFTHGFETSYLDAGRMVRVMGYGASADEVHAARIAKHNDLVRRGFKPMGSVEFSLRRFMPVEDEMTGLAHWRERSVCNGEGPDCSPLGFDSRHPAKPTTTKKFERAA